MLELPEAFAKRGINVKAATVDIADADAVHRAFDRFGDVHILINNAGVSHHPTVATTDPAGWRRDIAANLNGAFACAHAVLPRWSSGGAGNIVTVGSVNGLAALGDPAYSARRRG